MKRNSKTFCGICHHKVASVEKHATTEEHKRNLRRVKKEEMTSPRLPTKRRSLVTGSKI